MPRTAFNGRGLYRGSFSPRFHPSPSCSCGHGRFQSGLGSASPARSWRGASGFALLQDRAAAARDAHNVEVGSASLPPVTSLPRIDPETRPDCGGYSDTPLASGACGRSVAKNGGECRGLGDPRGVKDFFESPGTRRFIVMAKPATTRPFFWGPTLENVSFHESTA